MAGKRWKTSNKSVYNIGYHLIWCPKYRRKVLVSPIKERLEILLNKKAQELSVQIIKLSILPDHLHMFVSCSPVDSPHFIVQQFKGNSSHELRKEFPALKSRIPSLWTRSYYCESVGHISEDTVKKYIDDQETKQ